jgi:xylulokinase
LSYLIGTDIGTLGTKTVIVDVSGKVYAESFKEYNVITPQQGWAEQRPEIWADAVFTTIRNAISQSEINPKNVAGLSISALYGGSGIPVDKNYNPIRPCIIWADRRAIKECQYLRENIGVETLYEITANVIDPYYGYTKMLWIKNNEPQNWDKIHKFETPNAYVIRRLTGIDNIDYSSAGNYGGIFNLKKRSWSSELMELLEISRDYFPDKIHSSEEIVGETSGDLSKKTGLVKGTPVCAGGIDAPVSALAGGAIMDGDLSSMLGTSMCNGIINHQYRVSPNMINYPYVVNAKKTLYSFTGISTAGFCVRWFRDQFGNLEMRNQIETGVDAYKKLDEIASPIPIGSDELIFLPHMMIGERAPYWEDYLRGAFLGLTVFHTKAHLFRSILEGVAYAIKYSLEVATKTGYEVKRATLVDGGARSPLWRRIIADVTNIEFHYIPDTLGAPIGDAILAGLGTGLIKDHKIIEEWIGETSPTIPNPTNVEKYLKHYSLYKDAVKKLSSFFSFF